MLPEIELQLHTLHLPNSSTGCHLSLVLRHDQSSTISAAPKFLSLDNIPGKGGREGGREGQREGEKARHTSTYLHSNLSNTGKSDTNYI